ncbi:MAG: hypothetical protein ACRYFK_14460 [Janthinobacterium lividum]
MHALSELAGWVLRHLPFDTWMNEATLGRRLLGIEHAPYEAADLLNLAAAAGWLQIDPLHADWYCLPTRCWLPKPLAA